MAETPSFEEGLRQAPPEVQARIQAWLGTQMFIARELGLEPLAWLEHVEWAIKNPLDYSFLGEGGVALLAGAADAVERATADKERALVMGAEAPPPACGIHSGKADNVSVRKAGSASPRNLGKMLDDIQQRAKKSGGL